MVHNSKIHAEKNAFQVDSLATLFTKPASAQDFSSFSGGIAVFAAGLFCFKESFQ